MKLLRCKKCGAVITTNETLMQNYMEEIDRLSKMAIKDKRNAAVYLNQAASLRKISTQILHLTAQCDSDNRRLLNELGELIHYVRENNLVSDEKLSDIQAAGREKARKNNEADEKRIEELYGNFNSILASRSHRRPTEKEVLKKMSKEK